MRTTHGDAAPHLARTRAHHYSALRQPTHTATLKTDKQAPKLTEQPNTQKLFAATHARASTNTNHLFRDCYTECVGVCFWMCQPPSTTWGVYYTGIQFFFLAQF